MKIIEQANRLNLIHKMISEERTGTPEVFSKHLKIGKRQLFNIIDELKIMGAPIVYNWKRRTYIYEYEYEINIEIKFGLSENELNNISGGGFNKNQYKTNYTINSIFRYIK